MAELRYITLEELVNEIPEAVQGLLSNDAVNDDTPVDAILKQRALAAESMFESAVSVRYDVPVIFTDGTVPEQVKQCIYALAKYMIYARRNKITAEIQAQYDTWMGWLSKVVAGKANIPVLDETGVVVDQGASPTVITGGGHPRRFGRFV